MGFDTPQLLCRSDCKGYFVCSSTVEQLSVKQWVAGSIPATRAKSSLATVLGIFHYAGMKRYPSAQEIVQEMLRRGHRVFQGAYNLNIVGLRSGKRRAGEWDDAVGMVYQDEEGRWQADLFQGTTDPGSYYLEKPINIKGTAILVPGQYRSVYTFGLHKRRYEALVQRQPMRFWRDDDRDSLLDMDGEIEEAVIGCNLHRASAHWAVPEIYRYSAACQVVRDPRDFAALMDLAHYSAGIGYGDRFSYTLLDLPRL